MIDVENQIYTRVAEVLRSVFPDINITGRTTFEPSEFPCVCFEEADSYVDVSGRDSARTENYTQLMYEVNVFSDKGSGAKAECKKIFSVIDDVMGELNFSRTSKTPVAMFDASKYRLVGRYKGKVGTDEALYRS